MATMSNRLRALRAEAPPSQGFHVIQAQLLQVSILTNNLNLGMKRQPLVWSQLLSSSYPLPQSYLYGNAPGLMNSLLQIAIKTKGKRNKPNLHYQITSLISNSPLAVFSPTIKLTTDNAELFSPILSALELSAQVLP